MYRLKYTRTQVLYKEESGMYCLSQQEQSLSDAYIILTYTRKVLQQDLVHVEKSLFKLKEPYIQLIHSSLSAISKELFEIKKQMHQRNIKVTFGTNDGTFTEVHLFCRGYSQTIRYLNANLKMKVQNSLEKHFTKNSNCS